MDFMLGAVVSFAGSFIPKGWAACDGQTLPVSQFPALFALLGTTYGGDGRSNFKLPDLRGRTPISVGQSPFHTYKAGEAAGAESVKLNENQITAHDHNGNVTLQLPANSGSGVQPEVNNGFPADYTGAYATSGGSTMVSPNYAVTISNSGQGTPIDTRSPFLVVTYIICVDGYFPPRD
jgi:microcystin-dependent protein